MEMTLAEETFIDDNFLRQLMSVGEVDLLVGIPSHNNAKTIGQIVTTIEKSFQQNFVRAFSVEYFEFWIRRDRSIAPLGVVEIYALKTPEPGVAPGKLEVTVTPSLTAGTQPTVTVDKYTLIPMDDTIMGDATTQGGVDQYIAGINTA